ncbi:MAG: hypothetical protein JO142_13390 [Burkholderiales bacterium]|nr:hypothetical protein [Burkholderiales bacterium]
MNLEKKLFFALMIAAGAVSQASAQSLPSSLDNVVDLGSLTSATQLSLPGGGYGAGYSFNDGYTFTLSSPVSSVQGSVADTGLWSLDVQKLSQVGYTSLSFGLFDTINGVTSQVGHTVNVIPGSAADLTFSGLQTGANNHYTLLVSGTEYGSNPSTVGTYSLTVSAVPIPGAVVLFGSGLVGLVGLGRRAKAQKA